MPKPKAHWTNKKYGKDVYEGKYVRDADGERIFIVFAYIAKTNKIHHVSFESAQAAKALGWVKS